jgi:hypothetical protein
MVGRAMMPAPATWTSGAPVFSFVESLISGCRWLVGARTSSTRTRVLPSPVRPGFPARGIVPPPRGAIVDAETGRAACRSIASCRTQISRFEASARRAHDGLLLGPTSMHSLVWAMARIPFGASARTTVKITAPMAARNAVGARCVCTLIEDSSLAGPGLKRGVQRLHAGPSPFTARTRPVAIGARDSYLPTS